MGGRVDDRVRSKPVLELCRLFTIIRTRKSRVCFYNCIIIGLFKFQPCQHGCRVWGRDGVRASPFHQGLCRLSTFRPQCADRTPQKERRRTLGIVRGPIRKLASALGVKLQRPASCWHLACWQSRRVRTQVKWQSKRECNQAHDLPPLGRGSATVRIGYPDSAKRSAAALGARKYTRRGKRRAAFGFRGTCKFSQPPT